MATTVSGDAPGGLAGGGRVRDDRSSQELTGGRPTVAEVNLDALAYNVRRVRARLAPRTRLWAVVKADAYGHGALPVARAALHCGADGLAVALAEEGAALRDAGVEAPILVLGATFPDQMDAVASRQLDCMVFDAATARDLGRHARRHNTRVRVHLKVDTGMARLGIPWDGAVVETASAIVAEPGLELYGLATHFASADAADGSDTRVQWERFLEVAERLRRAGMEVAVRHAANSAAAWRWPGMQADAVRVGIALYGVAPVPEADDLRPVLTVTTRVAQVKRVTGGVRVGYGGTFVTPGPLCLATIPIGYADGYRRGLSNRGDALVLGQRARVAGRVSMDQTVLALPAAAAVEPGDPVVLLGSMGTEAVWAEDWAQWLDTIPYEVLTGLSARVPRVYRVGDEIRRAAAVDADFLRSL